MAMTMNLGLGLEAELNYRQERLRADFRRGHSANKYRWWRRRPAAAVAGHRTPTATGVQHGAKAVPAGAADVAPAPVQTLAVRSRTGAAGSTADRAHAA
jgi:hypothetical protein